MAVQQQPVKKDPTLVPPGYGQPVFGGGGGTTMSGGWGSTPGAQPMTPKPATTGVTSGGFSPQPMPQVNKTSVSGAPASTYQPGNMGGNMGNGNGVYAEYAHPQVDMARLESTPHAPTTMHGGYGGAGGQQFTDYAGGSQGTTPGQGGPDLRNDVYSPGGSGGASGNTNTLAQRLVNYQFPGFNSVGGGSYTPGGDTNQARQMEMQQLKEAQAPDRAGLADSIFTRLEESSNPAWQANLRSVNQRNAAMGRGGSGMVTNELSDVTAQREKDLANVRGQLADSAAGLSLSDRLDKLNATRGVFGDFGNEDRANAGVNLDLRNEARGERSANLGYGLDKFGAESGLLGQLGGLEQNRFNQGVSNRNEMRTERDYQTNAAQRGIDNAMSQRQLEDQLQNNATNRQNQTVSTYGGLGYSGNPSSAYLGGADQLGQQGAAGGQSFADNMANMSYLDWLRKNGGMN